MSILRDNRNNLKQIFSPRTLKGRFVWMAIFFMFICLGFSLAILLQKQRIENKLNQIMDIRLIVREDIETFSGITRDLISNSRNDILKRLPFRSDEQGNYQQYQHANAILNRFDSLKEFLPDSSYSILTTLRNTHEKFNLDFIRADSIWSENNSYYRSLNQRDKLVDKAEIVYLVNDQFQHLIAVDTIKLTTIEAEDGYYSGAFINYSHPGYEGSGYADYVNQKDDYLEFAFRTATAGEHLFFYRYALGNNNRTLDIFLDDQLIAEQYEFRSLGSDWGQWSTSDTIMFALDSGVHKLKAIATGKSGPNIDKLYVISPAVAESMINNPQIMAAIPDSSGKSVDLGLSAIYRHEVNTMSAVEDILRASLNSIQFDTRQLRTINENMIQADDRQLRNILQQTNLINFTLLGLVVIIALVLLHFIIKSLNKSLQHPLSLMQNLAAGDITRKAPNTKDELNQVIEAGNTLREHLQKASDFANNIGEGDLDSSFQPGSEKDVLGKALLQMRDKLKAIAEEDRKSNWSSRGITLFADMVRKHFDTLEDFSAVAISQLVKYMDARLGMLYIKNDEDEEQIILELKGCYAYDRNKYLEHSIEPGFGYPGQVFLEKETVYLTDLPQDYVKIGSSLGETPPRSLIVVPLLANDLIEGVVEIASLKKYEQYQITFVEKVAEIFATHIVNVRVNEKTNRLLEESKKQAEEMKAQEEELRQNMEELEAMHEQMRRDQEEEQKRT